MAVPAAALAKAAAMALSSEKSRKTIGWVVAAILSPAILLVAFFCSLGSGAADHNRSAVELCFYGGTIPVGIPAEYRTCIEEMRNTLTQLDTVTSQVSSLVEGERDLDVIRIKAIFYALYFGTTDPASQDLQRFADCFVTYEERIRTVTSENEDGTTTETEETYTVAVPITDLMQIYENIVTVTGNEVTPEQQANADSVYSLLRYGYTGSGSGFAGSDVPFIGADGFCSPIGEHWRTVVTSEFGNRIDPITGQQRGHTGIDLAVPTGTPIRAALSGTVTVSSYDQGGYGYYVMIDHGNGLTTLYGHCSQLMVSVDRAVEAGTVVAMSGSTGRSTGPHLHFEVRVNGSRVNPRSYLP